MEHIILKDTNTYTKLTKDLTNSFKKKNSKIVTTWGKNGIISEEKEKIPKIYNAVAPAVS